MTSENLLENEGILSYYDFHILIRTEFSASVSHSISIHVKITVHRAELKCFDRDHEVKFVQLENSKRLPMDFHWSRMN